MKVNNIVLDFDWKAWNEYGGDHPDGNNIFYRPAKVIKVYQSHSIAEGVIDDVMDIRWLGSEEVSKGHFYDQTEILK